MKRIWLITLLAVPLFGNPGNPSLPAGLEHAFPTLSWQVAQLAARPEFPLDTDKALRNLERLTGNNPSADLRRAMEMLLLPHLFRKRITAARTVFTVDGEDREWNSIPYADRPVPLTSKNPGDLNQCKAYLDGNGELHVLLRPGAAPGPGLVYNVYIQLGDNPGLDIFFQAWTDRQGALFSRWFHWSRNKTPLPDCVAVKLGQVLEARLPLRQAGIDIASLEHLWISANITELASGKKSGGSRFTLPVRSSNHALALFLLLLEGDHFRNGDSMSAAIALANSHVYALADGKTRARIRTDIVDQYRFYTELGNPELAAAPLLAKLQWADRYRGLWNMIEASRRLHKSSRITLDAYLEFADRISVLREIRDFCRKHGLVAASVPATTKKTEDFIHKHRLYRTTLRNYREWRSQGLITGAAFAALEREFAAGKYDCTILGKVCGPSEQGWINRQWPRLFNTKEGFLGDCGTATCVQMAFARALGIAPISYQHIHPKGYSGYSHNFPGYYFPALGRFLSCQIADDDGSNIENRNKFLHLHKPVWHHLLPPSRSRIESHNGNKYYYNPYFPGELTTTKRMANFLRLGMTMRHFAAVFLTNTTHTPGLLFTDTTAPATLADSDGDGLYDAQEQALGLNPRSHDSDGDGISDHWELWNGTDPKDPASPAKRPAFVPDGFDDELAKTNKQFTFPDPAGDALVTKNILDIAGLQGTHDGETLYVSVRFHKPETGVRCKQQELWITTTTTPTRRFWIGGGWNTTVGMVAGGTAHMLEYTNNKWVPVKTGDDLAFGFARDMEWIIPLKYLGYPNSLEISGSVMSGEAGKEVRNSDKTDPHAVILFPDSDHDGLSDREERRLGTNPLAWDSDGDGYSDLWELRHGRNPLVKEPTSPLIAVDGYLDDILTLKGGTITDPRGDSTVQENRFDIVRLAGKVLGTNLYIGAGFHGSIAGLKAAQHELWLTTEKNGQKQFFFIHSGRGAVGGRDNSGLGMIMRYDPAKKKWETLTSGARILFNLCRDAEWGIPLVLLGSFERLTVKYSVMSGPPGHEVRNSDTTGELMLR